MQLRKSELELEKNLLESYQNFAGQIVDPYAGYEAWTRIDGKDGVDHKGPASLMTLECMRLIGRDLAFDNPFAKNGHTNLRNFVVGTGFTYRLIDPKRRKTLEKPIEQALALWEVWVEEHSWWEAESEMQYRGDRDGEAFIRFFVDVGGELTYRWVEPDEVVDRSGKFEFGIITPPGDKQDIRGYVINDQPVEAHEVLHFKQNVDMNVFRGVPSFWCVRENLVRASKVLRNMSKVAELQAAIALIREHPVGQKGSSVATWLDNDADRTVTDLESGQSVRQKKLQPGTILDVPAGQKYHFPAAGINASEIVGVLDAELRAAASSVSMAEFIFSMNAANSNYASLLAAESPTLKAFTVRQRRMGRHLRKAFKIFLKVNVALGRLDERLLELKCDIQGPSVKSRNEFQETRSREIRHRNGLLSLRTWGAQEGLDYDAELDNNKSDEIIIPPSAKDWDEELEARKNKEAENEGDDSRGNKGKPGKGMDPNNDSAAG